MDLESLVRSLNNLDGLLSELAERLPSAAPQRDKVDLIRDAARQTTNHLDVIAIDEQINAELGRARRTAGEYRSSVEAVFRSEYLLSIFLQAEERLLLEYQATQAAARRLTDEARGLASVAAKALDIELRLDTDTIGPLYRFIGLRQFQQEAAQDAARREVPDWLKRAFWITGGVVLAGINGGVFLPTLPISAGLTAAGLAASTALGGALIGKGLERK